MSDEKNIRNALDGVDEGVVVFDTQRGKCAVWKTPGFYSLLPTTSHGAWAPHPRHFGEKSDLVSYLAPRCGDTVESEIVEAETLPQSRYNHDSNG